jgi:guanylate kinase
MPEPKSPERKGLVLVVCAPSGTGKSTLTARLREEFPEIGFSVSYTTRPPREGERDGEHYHFVSRDRFIAMRSRGEFCEWAEVHDNFYGTATQPVRDMLEAGSDVLFDIDVQGAMQLRRTFPEGVYAFLLPPSREELLRRLKGRGTDSPEAVERRMENARGELERAGSFDFWVVNDEVERAYQEFRSVYLAGKARPMQYEGMLDELLEEWNDG